MPPPTEEDLKKWRVENWEFFNAKVLKPFLTFLEFMIDKGADVTASVGKLIKFRPEYTKD